MVFLQGNNLLLLTIFSGCEITGEGMKSISSFLSHDGIVLEELDLRNTFDNSIFNGVIISNISIGYTRLELKPIEEVIVDGILTNINMLVGTSFDDNLKTWRTELVPLFISRCELLCFTQDLNNSQDSLFHFLGLN